MSNQFQESLTYVRHLRAEHKRLRGCLYHVEQQWLEVKLPPTTDVVPQLIESLQVLRVELVRHFEQEELGGCLEEAVSHRPSLSHEATRLYREHQQLLAQLDRLIEGLRAVSGLATSTEMVEEEFRAFTKRLLEHEAAENRILEQGFGVQVE